ncbi:MAG: hypothetical protein U0704_13530 [Candidatus Eisenbacteria bacterium]
MAARSFRSLPLTTALVALAALGGALAAGHARRPAPAARAAVATAASAPRIAPERAMALALNDLAPADGGYTLVHPRHTVRFDAGGVTFEPRRGRAGAGACAARMPPFRWSAAAT